MSGLGTWKTTSTLGLEMVTLMLDWVSGALLTLVTVFTQSGSSSA